MARTRKLRQLLPSLAVAVTIAAAGCGEDAGGPVFAETGTAGETTVAEETTTTTEAATTTEAEETTTTEAAAPTTTSGAAGSTAPAFPPAREDLVQGGETPAAVLAVSLDPQDPTLAEAAAIAAAAGYEGVGITDCDAGVAEAQNLDPAAGTYYSVSVYFATGEEANQAVDAFHESGYASAAFGIVTTFCLD